LKYAGIRVLFFTGQDQVKTALGVEGKVFTAPVGRLCQKKYHDVSNRPVL